jgi:hypothetical protein
MSYSEMDGGPAVPRSVLAGAIALAVVTVLHVIRIGVAVALNLADDSWSAGGRSVFLVLNVLTLLIAGAYLTAAYHIWRGRAWAWITAITLLTLTTLYGAVLLIPSLIMGEFPWLGAGVFGPAAALLALLVIPRSTRAYFTKPAVRAETPTEHGAYHQ